MSMQPQFAAVNEAQFVTRLFGGEEAAEAAKRAVQTRRRAAALDGVRNLPGDHQEALDVLDAARELLDWRDGVSEPGSS